MRNVAINPTIPLIEQQPADQHFDRNGRDRRNHDGQDTEDQEHDSFGQKQPPMSVQRNWRSRIESLTWRVPRERFEAPCYLVSRRVRARMVTQAPACRARAFSFRTSLRNRYTAAPAPVAQLDRAPGFEPGGRRFESVRARINSQKILRPPGPCGPEIISSNRRQTTRRVRQLGRLRPSCQRERRVKPVLLRRDRLRINYRLSRNTGHDVHFGLRVDGVLPPSSANGQREHDETNET